MQVGALTAFLSYLMQILMSVMMATFMLMMVPRSAVCADRIVEVLDTDTSVVPPPTRSPTPPRARHARPRRRRLLLPRGRASRSLRDVSFEARPGQTIAVIGSTGAGKSPWSTWCPGSSTSPAGRRGRGIDVRDLDPDALWSRIGLVPQKAYLFSGTIATNLRHGKPDATDDEIWEALEIAQARDFVEAMPEGLEAPSPRAAPTSPADSDSARRCRWPPEKFVPPWLTGASSPSGSAATKSRACATFFSAPTAPRRRRRACRGAGRSRSCS